MGHIAGRGRYARETYPEGSSGGGAASLPAVAYDQNQNAWSQVSGDPVVIIATATIDLQPGSSLRIDGTTTFSCSAAEGPPTVTLFPGDAVGTPLAAPVRETINNAELGTLNLPRMLGPQPGGPITITLVVDQNSDAGTTVSGTSDNTLILTEVFASQLP